MTSENKPYRITGIEREPVMTDQEIIRKAVELADGLLIRDGSAWYQVKHDYGDQAWLDALAAQLVRQVDAAGGEVWFRSREKVFVFKDGERARGTNDDRTMNTLRAIVESGVLDET